ncbi:hypothetical protein V2J09_013589 [Rumex salicifolius]
MSQGVAGGMGGGSGSRGPDFDLSDEILRVIPTDAYEQLDLARKLTSMAIASRVSNLESETALLRRNMSEKDRLIRQLEERASHLEKNFQEAESRLKPVLDENVKLAQERDSLSATVKKLTRDLSKLETFKRQLMKSLSEDASPTETVDIGTYDQSVSRAYPDTAKPVGQRFSTTPYHITPRLTPIGTPKIVSAVGSPQKTSGSTTPKLQYEKKVSFSPWIPSSQQSSAANSPPRARQLSGRPPKLDGKEFFRQARSRLSYEQFSAFLANIKDLNAQKQSREETLKKAEDIFGAENKDLYLSFQGLISRNVH